MVKTPEELKAQWPGSEDAPSGRTSFPSLGPRMPLCQRGDLDKMTLELLFALSLSANGRDLKPDDTVGTIFLGWCFSCFSHSALGPEILLPLIAIIVSDKIVEC